MNHRFTLDRRSFEQFLAALSFVQQLKRQAVYQSALNDPNQPFFSLLQLQRAINSGTIDLPLVMASIVKLTQSVVGANAAGVWLFRNEDEFSCCARIGNIYDPDRLGADILAQLADSTHPDSNSCVFSPTLRKASHFPGSPNSVAITALRVNEKIVGAVAAFSGDFDAFASRDLHNLHFLGGLLEQALQKALQAGYREAVALEHAALLKLLEKIGPHVHELDRQSSLWQPIQAYEKIEDSAPSGERAVYRRLQQAASSAGDSCEPAEVTACNADPSAADLSVPGVGVRAALGDVREFTGEETSFFLREAVRSGSALVRGLTAQCCSGMIKMGAATTSRMRNLTARVVRIPRTVKERASSVPFAHLSSITASTGDRFTRLLHWRLKVRLVGLGRLRPSSWLRFDSPSFVSERSRLVLLLRSFAATSRTVLNDGKNRFSYLLRLSKIQARSFRRELRQGKANVYAAMTYQRTRVRVAQRRQKTILTNSAEITGQALQHAGESVAEVASSAGHSTITAFSTLKSHVAVVKRPSVNPRALRRSVGAIGVLGVMGIFLALQVSLRHSLQHVNAASMAAIAAATLPGVPAAVAEITVQPKPGPTSHLEITDTSVADTLHDLTRYEIVTLQRAAEYGDDEAAFQLGMAYETGYYVRQNCSKAAHWVKVAAESGNPAAAYNLGLRYRDGDGLQAEESAAEHWFGRASARQYSPAKLALAAVR